MSRSASPREPEDVEPPAPSPDDNEPQQPEEMNRPDDPGDAGLGYDFEVKEQDRWLPIANGECTLRLLHFLELPPACSLHCRDSVRCCQLGCLLTPWVCGGHIQRRISSTYNAASRLVCTSVESEAHPPAYDLQPATRAADWTNNDAFSVPAVYSHPVATIHHSLEEESQDRVR